MELKLGLRITKHGKSIFYEYLPPGRLEIEGGANDNCYLLQENGDLLLCEGYILEGRLLKEDDFNFLQENGDYLSTEGIMPTQMTP